MHVFIKIHTTVVLSLSVIITIRGKLPENYRNFLPMLNFWKIYNPSESTILPAHTLVCICQCKQQFTIRTL